jgi:hypothetical protein
MQLSAKTFRSKSALTRTPVWGKLPPLELNFVGGRQEGRDIKPLPIKTRRPRTVDESKSVDEYYMSLSEEDRQLLLDAVVRHDLGA